MHVSPPFTPAKAPTSGEMGTDPRDERGGDAVHEFVKNVEREKLHTFCTNVCGMRMMHAADANEATL
jgi:hypothetical protein